MVGEFLTILRSGTGFRGERQQARVPGVCLRVGTVPVSAIGRKKAVPGSPILEARDLVESLQVACVTCSRWLCGVWGKEVGPSVWNLYLPSPSPLSRQPLHDLAHQVELPNVTQHLAFAWPSADPFLTCFISSINSGFFLRTVCILFFKVSLTCSL